ncbi:MAG: hypothetical protein GXX96_24605 [Planctomycetaceae bacterium]|nr:hypothetical protein [Planctomycetaceae bacterium]
MTRLALDWKATLPPGEEQPRAKVKAKAQAKPARDRLSMFKIKDTNQDGNLSLEEYLHNFPDQAEGRRRFPTFDANQDGTLSEEEFVKMGKL